MEKQDTMRVITLADLWEVFIHHIIPIVLIAAICVVLVLAYGTIILTPKYSSTSTLYILKQDNSNDYVYTQADFTMALNIVNDCTYMAKSHEVLDKVISQLNLDTSYKELYSSITIENPDNTRILEVTVETADAMQSKKIVDAICRTAADKINDTMGIDQVNVYSAGTVGNNPSNSIQMTTYMLIGIVAAIIVYSAYLIAFILDDKIKTEEDVAKYLGLSVLGEIPNSKNAKKNRGKYQGYYSNSKKVHGGKSK